MNRLSSPARPGETTSPSLHAPSENQRLTFEQSLAKFNAPRAPRFSLFSPLHYEPNYAYPLVVWLHGPRDDERQLNRVLPHMSVRNYAAIGPRGTCLHDDDTPGFHWGENDGAVLAAETHVLEAIDAARKRWNIAADKIFLAGFQCGGTMALRLGLRHSHLFAGALSIGGPFPISGQPLVALQHARRLPLFIGYGRDSDTYTVDRVCAELRLFHAAAMKVSLFQYPCGDELTTKMLVDVNRWIMERVTGQPMTLETPAELPPVEVN